MAAHIGRVTSPLTGEPEAIPSVGVAFEDTPANREMWKKWVNWLWTDNLMGVLLNTLTIVLTSILTFSLLYPKGITIPKGWSLVVEQGKWFEALFGEAGRIAMLILGFFFLFDVFIVAGDLYSRFIADASYTVMSGEVKDATKAWATLFIGLGIIVIGGPLVADVLQGTKFTFDYWIGMLILAIYLFAVTGVLAYSAVYNWPYTRIYYSIFSIFTVMGIVQVFFKSPGGLIMLTGITNMFIMAFLCTVFLYLSWFYLPKVHPAGDVVRPSWIHFIILLVITLVFWAITGWYIGLKLKLF